MSKKILKIKKFFNFKNEIILLIQTEFSTIRICMENKCKKEVTKSLNEFENERIGKESLKSGYICFYSFEMKKKKKTLRSSYHPLS